MTCEQILAKLSSAKYHVSAAMREIDDAWGTQDDRNAAPTAFVRLADAGALLERAKQKISKAEELRVKGK